MDVHPSNDLHTCKMKHEDNGESKIFQIVIFHIQYNLQTRLIQV